MECAASQSRRQAFMAGLRQPGVRPEGEAYGGGPLEALRVGVTLDSPRPPRNTPER